MTSRRNENNEPEINGKPEKRIANGLINDASYTGNVIDFPVRFLSNIW